MIKNTPHNEYILRIIKNFDETTFLNSDLNGQDTPELKNTELKYNKEKIVEFCKKIQFLKISYFYPLHV